MNIALFGYGKMGKMLENLGTARGHSFPLKIELNTEVTDLDFSKIDVAIDFSTPEAAFDNIVFCLENGIPIISGTTGWLDKYNEVTSLCESKEGAFLYASNFSLGVNIFFELNRKHALTEGRLLSSRRTQTSVCYISSSDENNFLKYSFEKSKGNSSTNY